MKDIETNEEVYHLVKTFYTKVLVDKKISHFFTEVMQLDLETHLPKIADFWASVLLGDMKYKGNPMTAHISLNEKSPLTKDHFDRWLYLWEQTINELYKGEKADLAIYRAKSIAGLMQYKISAEHNNSLLH